MSNAVRTVNLPQVNIRPRTPASGARSDDAGVAVRELPAWAVSLVLHVAILLVLGSITRITILEPDPVVTSTIEPLDAEAFHFDATVVDQVGSDSDLLTLSPSLAAATHHARDPQERMEKQFEEELLTVEHPALDALTQPREDELVMAFESSGGTDHVGGVEGAVDRLTLEIAASLKERKTLVVWLFDASLSVNEHREAIADRFENVYRQLGMLDKDGSLNRALLTAVASFGHKTTIMTPDPLSDVKSIVDAVRKIEVDETGIENVFTAVTQVTKRWESHRTRQRRNMMVIIVTDERGDDYQDMESVIHRLRRLGIKVYCVGHAAPFGRDEGYITWEYDDGFKEDLPMDQGPETVMPELLQLGFWGNSGRNLDRLSSGYGPYALTRLCHETGGLYLISFDNTTRGPKFDPFVMKTYAPDYRPIADYVRELRTNLAKGKLVEAAQATRVTDIPIPQLQFRADNDTVLRQQITEAQKPAAVLDERLVFLYGILVQGEKDRPRLTEPRWRASYDLAMGRVLAMRARIFGYNAILADMKLSPKTFQNSESNQWRLVPSAELPTAPLRKLASEATTYLTRVVDEHPGTPWALMAEVELSQPMGWEWNEAAVNYPDMRGPGDGDDRPRLLLAEEEERRREEERQRAQQRVRPKL